MTQLDNYRDQGAKQVVRDRPMDALYTEGLYEFVCMSDGLTQAERGGNLNNAGESKQHGDF